MLTKTYATIASCALINVAGAHHGIANFDLNTDIELTGVVTSIDFLNPHSWIYLDVTAEDGTLTAWRCETRGATVLRRSGWSPDMFPAGIEITITGSPDRRDPTTCYLGTAIFPDGRSVDRYGQLVETAPQAPAERQLRTAYGDPNIAGDWASEQRVLTDPRGLGGAFLPISVAENLARGAVPEGVEAFPGARGTAISLADDPVEAFWNDRPSAMPLTEAGAQAIAVFDGASTDNPRLRCEATNIVFDWTFEMDVNRITQTAREIKLFYGSMGIERTVHLNLSEHPTDIEPSMAGHSIGYWDDDVLIVDSVGFNAGILSADGRVPHSDQLRIVERFSLDPETMVLARSYVADDPLYLVGQYTGTDAVQVSELPYHGTSECEDRTYRPQPAVTEADETPWWMFWK